MIRKFKKFLIRTNANKWTPLAITVAGMFMAGHYAELSLLIGIYFIVKNKNI